MLAALYKNVGCLNSNNTFIDLCSDDYRGGQTIIPFSMDLNPLNSTHGSYDTEPGHLSLSLKFNRPTEEHLSVFCMQLVNSNSFLHQDGVIINAGGQ